MGIPKSRSLRTHTPIISSMKFLVILALAVAVSAEADPQLMYNTYGSGWPITSYVQKPVVSTKPLVYTKPVQYHAASPGVSHTVLKREAEPYHHVMPVTTYGHSLVHPTQSVVYKQAVQPVVYKQAVQPVKYMAGSYADDSVKPFDYAAKGKYMANSAGTIHKAKREAEADPALIYGSGIIPTTYTAGIYSPSVYSTGITHLTYPT